MHIVEGRISFPFGQNQNNKGAGSTDKVSIISKICHATQDNDHATEFADYHRAKSCHLKFGVHIVLFDTRMIQVLNMLKTD